MTGRTFLVAFLQELIKTFRMDNSAFAFANTGTIMTAIPTKGDKDIMVCSDHTNDIDQSCFWNNCHFWLCSVFLAFIYVKISQNRWWWRCVCVQDLRGSCNAMYRDLSRSTVDSVLAIASNRAWTGESGDTFFLEGKPEILLLPECQDQLLVDFHTCHIINHGRDLKTRLMELGYSINGKLNLFVGTLQLKPPQIIN